MKKVIALNNNCKLTYCSALPENRGKGRCNHVAHQNPGETALSFSKRATEIISNIKKEKIKKSFIDQDGRNIKEYQGEIVLSDEGKDKRIRGAIIDFIESEDSEIRKAAAEMRYGLNRLAYDPDPEVRAIVAKWGYNLNELVNDEESIVRSACAESYDYAIKLIDDPDPDVRDITRKIRRIN